MAHGKGAAVSAVAAFADCDRVLGGVMIAGRATVRPAIRPGRPPTQGVGEDFVELSTRHSTRRAKAAGVGAVSREPPDRRRMADESPVRGGAASSMSVRRAGRTRPRGGQRTGGKRLNWLCDRAVSFRGRLLRRAERLRLLSKLFAVSIDWSVEKRAQNQNG